MQPILVNLLGEKRGEGKSLCRNNDMFMGALSYLLLELQKLISKEKKKEEYKEVIEKGCF